MVNMQAFLDGRSPSPPTTVQEIAATSLSDRIRRWVRSCRTRHVSRRSNPEERANRLPTCVEARSSSHQILQIFEKVYSLVMRAAISTTFYMPSGATSNCMAKKRFTFRTKGHRQKTQTIPNKWTSDRDITNRILFHIP